MSDLVTPGEVDAAIDNRSAGAAWAKAGEPWIVDGIDIADTFTSLDDTGINSFRHSTSTGLTVTISGGEAYVAGWLARDRTTDVDLPASSTSVVYVGYDAGAILADTETPPENDNVIVGLEGAFAADDPRTPIWEFTTDADSVTASTDLRQLQKPITFDPIEGAVDVNVGTFRVAGSSLATEGYVDENRYTDPEARAAVVAADLPGSEVRFGGVVDGHPDGLRMGPDGYTNYSHLNGETTIYSLQDPGAIRFRNYLTGPGDLLRVDSVTGDGWVRGGWEVDGGLLDNSEGDGVVPKVLNSGESLPSDTVTGRIIYDPSREQ